MPRQPLYPHIPKSRMAAASPRNDHQEIELRFLPDSPELLTQTMNGTGLRARLDSVFQQAINRVRRAK